MKFKALETSLLWGIWNAALKSMGQHLYKTVSKQVLTYYEEFLNLLLRADPFMDSILTTHIADELKNIMDIFWLKLL